MIKQMMLILPQASLLPTSFNIARLEKKSYLVSYTFTEEKSGESLTKTDGTPYVLNAIPKRQADR